MIDDKQQQADEIDLLELAAILWNGKAKIMAFVVIALVGCIASLVLLPAPEFTARTELKPISAEQSQRYRASNAFGFFEITPEGLLLAYIEELDQRMLFETAIDKYALLDRADYREDLDYHQAVTDLAASVLILPPVNPSGVEKGIVRKNWTIEFAYNDEQKWRQVLSDVHQSAQESTKKLFKTSFSTSLNIAKVERDFKIEDINTQISNALIDYERRTESRLAFLREQASIARELGVVKSTIEAQIFSGQNGSVTSIDSETPFYLRGYAAIEKEIALISAREDKKSFIDGLLVLEQNLRQLQQDKIIERAERTFSKTPVGSETRFAAVSNSIAATRFEDSDKTVLMLMLAAMVGGIVGMFYVLISHSMSKRKKVVLLQP